MRYPPDYIIKLILSWSVMRVYIYWKRVKIERSLGIDVDYIINILIVKIKTKYHEFET